MSEHHHRPAHDLGGAAPDSLQFLVGSWNRFEVLAALNRTSRTRAELQEMTGVSRPTLSRILSDLIDRGWASRHNDEYRATHMGRLVADEVAQLVADLDTAETLGSALEWVPTDRLGFDLAHLADAEILTPRPEDHTAPMRRLARMIEETATMRVVATGVTYQVVETITEACQAGNLAFECVMDDNGLTGIRSEPDLAAGFADLVTRPDCAAYHYTGEDGLVDFNLIDDALMLCGFSAGGLPQGILVSTDETVRSWGAVRFERRRDAATPLASDAFTV